jgi:hypothetical protein
MHNRFFWYIFSVNQAGAIYHHAATGHGILHQQTIEGITFNQRAAHPKKLTR